MLKKANPWEKTKDNNFDDTIIHSSKYNTLIILIVCIIIWLIIVLWIFFDWQTSNNWESINQADSKICRWSDGLVYDKPKNATCDGGKSPQWWVCNNGYKSVSENYHTWDRSSWYCACRSSWMTCDTTVSNISDTMQFEISKANNYLNNMHLNLYSTTSVNAYNQQVENVNMLIAKRNRYLSENCSCWL